MTKLKEIPMRKDSQEERIAFVNRLMQIRETLQKQRLMVANRYGYGSPECAAIERILEVACDEALTAHERAEELCEV